MSSRHAIVWLILKAIRENADKSGSLSSILKDAFPRICPEGKFPSHSGSASILFALFDLFDQKLINISHNDTTLDEKTWPKLVSRLPILGEGTTFNLLGEGKNFNLYDEITLRLTNHFYKLQYTLGFSVTNESKFIDRYAVKVAPIFGRPKSLEHDIFVLMPFKDEMKPVFEDHISNVCRKMALSCMRADDIFGTDEIMRDIWAGIFSSSITIADCTGRNPNVFYEMGIAHTLGKPTIAITQNIDDVPFDIRHRRIIAYQYTPRGMESFEHNLEATISQVLDSSRRQA